MQFKLLKHCLSFKAYKQLLFIFFIFILSLNPVYAITLSATNAGGSQTVNGILTYYYPMVGPVGFCASANQKLYPSSLTTIDPTADVGLEFQITSTSDHLLSAIANNASPGTNEVSIIAEYAGDSNHTKITLFDKSNGYNDSTAEPYYVKYGNVDYQTRSFGIALKVPTGRTGTGFCSFINALSTSYQCQPDAGDAISPVAIKIGLVRTGNNFTDTNADISSQINIVFASCPQNTTNTGITAPSLNYKLTPGDKRIKVENSSVSPTDYTNSVPIQFPLLFGAQTNSANLTYSSSSIRTSLTGSSNLYFANDLANDKQYCFSIGYVNFAGFVTTGNSWGESALPNVQCSTPSEIEGFLDRSSCFIASAVFEDEFDSRLEVLRQFRDQILSKSKMGKAFIHWYYAWSPDAARWVFQHPDTRPYFKPLMYPLLWFARTALFMQDFFISNANADDQEVQPYIDSFKKKHGIKSSPRYENYDSAESLQTTTVKPEKTGEVQPYLNKIKEKYPETKEERSSSPQPYIESLKAGRELKEKKRETVNKAAGVAVIASDHFQVSSDKATANSFESVYNTKDRYNVSATVFFEYQFIHDRYWGSLGLLGSAGVISTKGKGVFIKNQTKSDDVNFSFFAVPLTIGPTYRLSQLRYLVPFAHIGLLGVPILEMRDDLAPAKRAFSRGYNATLGVSLNLDWISRKNAWDQYDTNGVIHTYLLVQWQYLRTISSTVRFNHNGLYAGLMFEF